MPYSDDDIRDIIRAKKIPEFVLENMTAMPLLIKSTIQFKRVSDQLKINPELRQSFFSQFTTEQLLALCKDDASTAIIASELPLEIQKKLVSALDTSMFTDPSGFFMLFDALDNQCQPDLIRKFDKPIGNYQVSDAISQIPTLEVEKYIFNTLYKDMGNSQIYQLISDNPHDYLRLIVILEHYDKKSKNPSLLSSVGTMFKIVPTKFDNLEKNVLRQIRNIAEGRHAELDVIVKAKDNLPANSQVRKLIDNNFITELANSYNSELNNDLMQSKSKPGGVM
ncbi:MAG: hypothetical protein P1U74_11155 [Legionellaceae bacterium]|nr:hypothetical protein [Legionellaceae bacterium]